MTMYQVEYDYSIPEYGTLTIDLDDTLTNEERETQAIQFIKEMFPDIENITNVEIKNMDKEVSGW